MFFKNNKTKPKVLLVQVPPWGTGTPPLGIAYLATFLKSRGWLAEIYDLNMDIFSYAPDPIKQTWEAQDFAFWSSGKAVENLWQRTEHSVDRILSFETDLIGFSATFASAPFLNSLLPVLKRKAAEQNRNLTVMVGGAGVSYAEDRAWFNQDFIDYFVAGEGEASLLHLLQILRDGKTISGTADLKVWKDRSTDHALCLQSPASGMVDIHAIPSPTFEEFDLELYTEKDALPVVSSRGCIRQCVFCCDSPLRKPYRVRDPKAVAQEIECLVKKYHRKRFEFCDLLINGDLKFLDEFSERLIRRGLGVSWGGQATVRKDMDAALLKKMKKAGCGGLTFGIESFSDNVLHLVRKGTTAKEARDMLARAKETGMTTEINLMVGFPGETEEDVNCTIDFIRQHAALIDQVNSLNICTIGPGMYVFDHLEEYGIDRDGVRDRYAWFNRDRSNTLDIRIQRHQQMLVALSELRLKPVWQNLKDPGAAHTTDEPT